MKDDPASHCAAQGLNTEDGGPSPSVQRGGSRTPPRPDDGGSGHSRAPPGTHNDIPAHSSPRNVKVGSAYEFLAALKRSRNTTIDLGGRTLSFVSSSVANPDLTVLNGTLKCRSLVVEPSATNFCCRNLIFQFSQVGGAEDAAADPLVAVRGTQGVVLEACKFGDCGQGRPAASWAGDDAACAGAGLCASDGAMVLAMGCEFNRNAGAGLVADGPKTVVIAHCLWSGNNGTSGVLAQRGAEVKLERSGTCAGNRYVGMFAHGGGKIVATRVVCNDNHNDGAMAANGGSLTLDACKMVAISRSGVFVAEGSSKATVTGLEIVARSVRRGQTEPVGDGIVLRAGASCRVRGAKIDGCLGALTVFGAGSRLRASDVVVTNSRQGLRVCGGTCALKRSTLDGCAVTAIEAAESDSSVTAVDVTVKSCGGRGVHVERAALATLTKCVVERAGADGVFADGVGTVVEMEDVAVTRSTSCGVLVLNGGRAHIQGGECTDGASFGVTVEGRGTAAKISGMVCARNARSGLVAMDGAEVAATKCSVEGNAKYGGVSWGGSSSLVLEDCKVVGNGEAATFTCQGGTVTER
ncbi:unnamed protein product [Pedinophyceae sp. YPF-701]|nr:unnamed protein product [Pedinophyceae sp. YPF-701]